MNVCTSSATNMLRSLLIVFSAFSSACAADLSSEYAHRAVLDPEGRMSLYWTVNWHKESVSLAVEAATTGWVGFGISSGNGKMAGSDVVIGWVKDSQGYLTVRLLKQFLSRSPSLSKLPSTFIYAHFYNLLSLLGYLFLIKQCGIFSCMKPGLYD